MRLPWNKSKEVQLDLLDTEPVKNAPHQPVGAAPPAIVLKHDSGAIPPVSANLGGNDGRPMLVAVSMLYEDALNPRTEFPEAELDELADDIRQHGILQPIVVRPVDKQGQHRIHFGAKRWRAAQRAGLTELPVVIRDAPSDPYTQVAENQKRRGLTSLDLARFIKSRVDAGATHTQIAKRLGMNLTTVAHHLALLRLPPELDAALKSGRCSSPRTLHELSKLHADSPGQVQALLGSRVEITRAAVSAIRSAADEGAPAVPAVSPSDKLIAQANAACDRLVRALGRIKPPEASPIAAPDLIALWGRVEGIATCWLQGSDRQTPSRAKR